MVASRFYLACLLTSLLLGHTAWAIEPGTRLNREMAQARKANLECGERRCPNGNCAADVQVSTPNACEAEAIKKAHGAARRDGNVLEIKTDGENVRLTSQPADDPDGMNYHGFRYEGYLPSQRAHLVSEFDYEFSGGLLVLQDGRRIQWEDSEVSFDPSGKNWVECFNSELNGSIADRCTVLTLGPDDQKMIYDLTQSPCVQKIQNGHDSLKDVHWQNAHTVVITAKDVCRINLSTLSRI